MESTPRRSAASRLADAGFRREVAGADFDRIAKAADSASGKGIGLLLSGAAGSGKTMAMRCLYPKALFVSAFDPVEVEWLDDRSLVRSRRSVVIDDLGADAAKNSFGVWTSPISLFLLRAESAQSKGVLACRIHVTTNLSSREIDEVYGDRVLSRLLALTVPIRLAGGDHRPRHSIKFDGEGVS